MHIDHNRIEKGFSSDFLPVSSKLDTKFKKGHFLNTYVQIA